MIKSSITSSEDKVVPSGGTTDAVLGSLITNYNQALLKKQSLVSQVAPNSLTLTELDEQIANFRSGILDNLNNNMKALDLQASNFSRQGSQFRSSVSGLPEKQRLLGEIAREKSIKESLYLYLLQKREETALSKTTTTPYEQIDLANAYGPVSPDHKAVYVYCSIIGLVIPVLVIFLIGMLNDKIKSKDEVENGATAQIVGEINFIKRSENKILPSLEGGIVGEQFRIMRANLNFLQKGAKQQVILITSSGSGEGKSFVSLNLAAVLSKAGKKVALLDFDLRKPDESMPTTLTEKGIKDYLLGEATLAQIVQHLGELPTLHLYPSGRVVADVGDLIVSDRADDLFKELSDKYDTIVINTPPVGLVGDALILQKYSTLIGFVIRESYTKKKQLQYLNSLIETGKFTNTCVIYNGVRTGMKYGYYGYGYTTNNAYFERNDTTSRIAKVFKRKKSTTV
jgi:capsular exopolysaccharide synthesis family protein